MENKEVAIIGGGLGALSGAIRLARLGFTVQLFEKKSENWREGQRSNFGGLPV